MDSRLRELLYANSAASICRELWVHILPETYLIPRER